MSGYFAVSDEVVVGGGSEIFFLEICGVRIFPYFVPHTLHALYEIPFAAMCAPSNARHCFNARLSFESVSEACT